MLFVTVVSTWKGPMKFKCKVHHAETPTDLKLPDEFYTENGYPVPESNYEMEILVMPSTDDPELKPCLHTHLSKDGKDFVCYPSKLNSEKEAHHFFEIWCLGVACALAFGLEGDLDRLKKKAGSLDKIQGYVNQCYSVIIQTSEIIE